MEKKKTPEERGKRSEGKDESKDAYTPAILNEGPKKFRYDDWASI